MIGYLSQAEWVRRFGHYWWVYAAALATTVIPVPGWWRLVFVPIDLVGVFWLLIAQMAHDDQLCLQCVNAWPTDAAEVAERRWRWLWWYHFGAWVTIAAAVVVALWLFMWPILPAATLTLLLVGICFSQGKSRRLHNDLKPWCRWCRRRGDDDDDQVAPTPTPSETRS